MKLLNLLIRNGSSKAKFSTLLRKKATSLPHTYSYLLQANYCSQVQLSKENMSVYIYPNNTPIIQLDCEAAFNELTEKEKHYAHYLSKACWFGGLIDLLQTSSESPLIFILINKLFHHNSVSELKTIALKRCGFTEEDFTAFLIYTCGFLSNMGNYKGFGDTKFIPNLPKDKFGKLILSSRFAATEEEFARQLLSQCLKKIYSLKDKECSLGFPYKGTTTYLSKNITEEDLEKVKKFLKNQNLEPFNTRLFKIDAVNGKMIYEIRLASVLQSQTETEEDTEDEDDDSSDEDLTSTTTMDDHRFVITRGDYSRLLRLVNNHLKQAKAFAANKNEQEMIKHYIKSFRSGSIGAHKEGSRYWIRDKGPIVESYIGFIETYRDPAGMRGEFEGFVAIVNKKMSAKFSELVKSAETLLPLLPWPKDYELDIFLQPDFTSLDVLTYACSGIPAGICIPNYNDIRQSEGFKNVSLGNTIHVKMTEPPNFLNKADQDLVMKYRNSAFEINVGLHELLGHGSGKLFKEKDGSFNFDKDKIVDFVTNERVSSWYEDGETYDSVFGSLGSSYEECRAESVALYLCDSSTVLKIFGYEGEEASDITYIVWLSMALKGLEGLEMYDPKTDSWLQAHSQARFVILQVMLEIGEDFVKIEKVTGSDDKPDLLLTIDRSKLASIGKKAIGDFLGKLQLYRSTANVTAAKEMYDKYSLVSSEENKYPFLEYREVVMNRKKPRRMFVQANTYIQDNKVMLQTYPSTPVGMIQSWMQRFGTVDVDNILEDLWKNDKHHF